ncbi:MAG: ABC transporter permease [Pseudomonadota bacterium]
MAAAIRTVSAAHRSWVAGAAAALVAVPLLWAAAGAIASGLDGAAWRSLLAQEQLPLALALSVFTGLLATVISVAVAAWLLSHTFATARWSRATRVLAPMLAVPHAAFAIGLAFLVAPSGWILRALSPWATGFSSPPPWSTTQDPWGLALVAALVGKEVPFLLWAAATQLQRADAGARWQRELQVARSMGYSQQAAWWRVVWPQLWPRLHAPLLAVLAYSLTVVDMALIIGPASPPTAAVVAWQWLLDADVAVNAQGAALAWLLAFAVAVMAAALSLLRRHLRWRSRWVGGQRGRDTARSRAAAPLLALVALYAGVLLATAVGSLSGVWPFPAAWPQSWSMEGWRSVAASTGTLLTTFGLAITSSMCALVWALLWLENAPPHWNAALRRLAYLPLVLPPVLWVVGLHRLTLAWGLDTQWAGLWLAHTLAALPYTLIALSPAYLGFDTRYAHVAATLGRGRLAFLLRVKWPLLRASLWGALAVGFAVSIAQYLPTLFIGGGRFDTVTTEAVGLAAGGQRSVLAAYAWLQWLLPALFFALAAWAGRPRRFARRVP